ncbi:MAG TPA: glycosyltransferase family 4 protein [Caldilineaceae bacterium]|nr:glycosyltransferase family 4 protein [Caldilineaceae bacterium]
MKVGLIIYGSLETRSGGYLYDRMLVATLREAGHAVALYSLPWQSYPAHLLHNCRLGWAAKLIADPPDLLLQDELNHPSLFLLNRLLARRLACPLVSVVHHLRSDESHPPAVQPLYRAVERAYLNSVDGFLYNSQTTRRAVERHLRRPRPGYVAHPAADHIQPPDHRTVLAYLARRARGDRPLQVLFLGNVIPRKGLHLVVEALGHLPPGGWRLQIAGNTTIDPAYTGQVKMAAARAGIARQITWHGAVGQSRLRDLLAAADLLAVPSYEGFGIVYLEAMAFGLPVIAGATGAAQEIVRHGVNGYLVTPGNALELAAFARLFVDNRIHLATLGYQARLHYERHPTWRAIMSGALEWLHEFSNA